MSSFLREPGLEVRAAESLLGGTVDVDNLTDRRAECCKTASFSHPSLCVCKLCSCASLCKLCFRVCVCMCSGCVLVCVCV